WRASPGPSTATCSARGGTAVSGRHPAPGSARPGCRSRQIMSARHAAAFAAALIIQSAVARQPPSTFRAETRLVVLYATVKNSRSELVTDLDRRAFTVYENGRRQPITIFR